MSADNIAHLPMTVGDVISVMKEAEPDRVIVVYRMPITGAWRVGWSKMPMAEICLGKDLLTMVVEHALAEDWQEFT